MESCLVMVHQNIGANRLLMLEAAGDSSSDLILALKELLVHLEDV